MPELASCDVTAPRCLTGAEGKSVVPHDAPSVPKVGDWIYTPTQMSISHGEDDVCGGLAQVTSVEFCPQYNGGNHLVKVAQVKRGFFWERIRDDQARLREQFGKALAFDDPDYHDYGPDDGWQSMPSRGFWP